MYKGEVCRILSQLSIGAYKMGIVIFKPN